MSLVLRLSPALIGIRIYVCCPNLFPGKTRCNIGAVTGTTAQHVRCRTVTAVAIRNLFQRCFALFVDLSQTRHGLVKLFDKKHASCTIEEKDWVVFFGAIGVFSLDE